MAISFLSGFVEEAQKQVKLEYSGLLIFPIGCNAVPQSEQSDLEHGFIPIESRKSRS